MNYARFRKSGHIFVSALDTTTLADCILELSITLPNSPFGCRRYFSVLLYMRPLLVLELTFLKYFKNVNFQLKFGVKFLEISVIFKIYPFKISSYTAYNYAEQKDLGYKSVKPRKTSDLCYDISQGQVV